jgi:hypothetical protein
MLQEVSLSIPAELEADLVPLGKGGSRPSRAEGAPLDQENRERMKSLSQFSGETWFALAHWAKQTESLTAWDRKFAFSMGTQMGKGKALSAKQLGHAERIMKEARRLGFTGDS